MQLFCIKPNCINTYLAIGFRSRLAYHYIGDIEKLVALDRASANDQIVVRMRRDEKSHVVEDPGAVVMIQCQIYGTFRDELVVS
jgi:hypothetical protein